MHAVFRYFTILLLLASALALSPAHAKARAPTPETLEGGTLVNAEEVKKLQEEGAIVVDARVKLEYIEGHIKGAINVTYKEKSEKSVDFDYTQDRFKISKLPSDKETKLIFYCNGVGCWKGYKAAQAAIREGYTNVYWYRLGIPEWRAKGLPTSK